MFLYEGLVLKVRENGIISETQRYIHTVMHGPQTKEQLYHRLNGDFAGISKAVGRSKTARKAAYV